MAFGAHGSVLHTRPTIPQRSVRGPAPGTEPLDVIQDGRGYTITRETVIPLLDTRGMTYFRRVRVRPPSQGAAGFPPASLLPLRSSYRSASPSETFHPPSFRRNS